MTYLRTVLHDQHSLRLIITEEREQPVPEWVLAPEVSLWPWPHSLGDEVPPLTLSVPEARSLVAGLVRAVEMVEAAMPDRCASCGEPCKRNEVGEDRCFRCFLTADIDKRKQRRESMRVVRGSS